MSLKPIAMKLNLKTNRIIFAICIIHILLLFIVTERRLNHTAINHIKANGDLNLWLGILSDITFLISLAYLPVILKFTNEKKYIVSIFYVFWGFNVLNDILSYIPFSYRINSIILITMGVIISLLIITIIVISFRVKQSTLHLPFIILAIANILMLIINWGFPLLMPLMTNMDSYFKVARYIVYTRFMPISAITYIVYASAELFKGRENQLS